MGPAKVKRFYNPWNRLMNRQILHKHISFFQFITFKHISKQPHRILFYTYITRSLFEHEHFDFHPPPLYVACQLIALSLVLFGVYGLLTYRQLERIMTSIGDLAAIFLLKLSIWGREHLMAASCWLCTQRMLFSYTARPKCRLVYYDTITQEIKNTYACFLLVQPFWCCKTRGLGSHCSLT